MAKKKKPVAGKQARPDTNLFLHLIKVSAATLILIAVVVLAGLALAVLFPAFDPGLKTAAVTKPSAPHGIVFEVYPKAEKRPRPEAGRHTKGSAVKKTGPKPLIAIIIDDMGYDKNMAERFIGLDSSLTLSILPHSPFTGEIAEAAHQAGLEVMLHLPMEPVEYPDIDPGPGVLLKEMSPDDLIRQLEKNIAGVPHIRGVNNHMGSRLTAESVQLYQIFSVLKKKGLFFIDSCTTERSLCRPSAGKLQVPFAQRDVFLDNSLSAADIKRQIDVLLEIAYHKGRAVGIAHPHPETLRALERHLPALKKQARLVPASRLVDIGT